MNIVMSACPAAVEARQLIPGNVDLGRTIKKAGRSGEVRSPCEDMPLRCGPSSAVTVSSTTMRN